jgi:hypothetical protein
VLYAEFPITLLTLFAPGFEMTFELGFRLKFGGCSKPRTFCEITKSSENTKKIKNETFAIISESTTE